MSKAEEATNDFCTRCFKYGKCHKVQSECTIADSYQEGYEDGYHQAEKDLELTVDDIMKLDALLIEMWNQSGNKYQEVLKQFKDFKERKKK